MPLDYIAFDYYDPFIAHALRWPNWHDFDLRKRSFRDWVLESVASKWWDWHMLPEGLAFFVKHLGRYGLPLLIAENGMALRRLPDNRPFRRRDNLTRSQYLREHIRVVNRLVERGQPLIGYLHWSLFDNYEWGSFAPRFGLFSLDYTVYPTRHAVDVTGDNPSATYAQEIREARAQLAAAARRAEKKPASAETGAAPAIPSRIEHFTARQRPKDMISPRVFTGGDLATNGYLLEGREGRDLLRRAGGHGARTDAQRSQAGRARAHPRPLRSHVGLGPDPGRLPLPRLRPSGRRRHGARHLLRADVRRRAAHPRALPVQDLRRARPAARPNFVCAGEEFQIFHIPGHSPGSVVFYHPGWGVLISGDTLFCGGVGRWDLPGGSRTALLQGLRKHFVALPAETRVYAGHGPSTTIGHERETNPYLERL